MNASPTPRGADPEVELNLLERSVGFGEILERFHLESRLVKTLRDSLLAIQHFVGALGNYEQ